MTKHSDSPELTRLSGEQAEERTAREGRDSRTDLVESLRHFDSEFRHNKRVLDIAVSCAEKYAAAECSRLASRVEELAGECGQAQAYGELLGREESAKRIQELEKQVEHWKENHAECVRRKRVSNEHAKGL